MSFNIVLGAADFALIAIERKINSSNGGVKD